MRHKSLTFVTLTKNSSVVTKHPETSEIPAPPEVAVGTQFNVRHGTKTTPVFLPADGEAS